MTLFEKIIDRSIPAFIIYEDDDSIAFLDISQNTPGHTLLIPKQVSESFLDIDPKTLGKLMETAQKLAQKMMERLNAKGMNILMNCNEEAGQTVMHFHIHLIPRYRHDELNFGFEKHPESLEQSYEKLKGMVL